MSRWINLKWEILLYFVLASALSIGLLMVGRIYFFSELSETEWWLSITVVLLFAGISVGYYTAQRFQRRLDAIHLGVIQLTKGNLSGRIDSGGNGAFDRIFIDFNKMAASLEQRIKILQQLGEERVLQQDEANEEAVLEERRRLARDLHDTVSQQLFAIHMSASSLPKVLERDQELAKQVLDQLIQMSYLAQKQMRGLIAQLRPLELEGKSLADALDKWFPDYCRQNFLQGSLDIQLKGDISEAKEYQLFLIIQEAMANVVKHAAAKHVTLSLHDVGHQYVLAVEDDGQGFDQGQVRQGSYGLSTMQERAQKLGGDMEMFSKLGAGTRMKIHIPKFN